MGYLLQYPSKIRFDKREEEGEFEMDRKKKPTGTASKMCREEINTNHFGILVVDRRAGLKGSHAELDATKNGA